MPCHRQHRLFSSLARPVLASFSIWHLFASVPVNQHNCYTHTHTTYTQQYSPCSCSPLKTLDWFAVRYCCWFCVLRALKRSWGAASFALFVFVSVFCFCAPNQRPPGSRRDAQTDGRAGKRCAYRRLHSSTSSASASSSSSSSFSCLFSFSASQMWFIKFSKTHFPPPF